LFEAFAGDLGYQREKRANAISPNGGQSKGRSRIRLGAGGATLLREGHSDGTAGPLRYIIVVWWDKDASLYGYFTCFQDTGSGCEVRGTAHWDGEKFANDYEEVVDGKKLRFRDTFQDITANSHTLVFAWIKDDGSMELVIISKAVRRSKH